MSAVLLMLPLQALAETAAEIPSAYADDGIIRVRLKSLGTPQTVQLTLNGVYSVENDAGFFFADGTQPMLTAVGNCIYMGLGGMTLALGREVTFTRHSSADDTWGGVQISVAGTNLYTGDLTLQASEGQLTMTAAVPMEEYLMGVVAYEMNDSFPLEALKAQTVAARTYALNKKQHAGEKSYDVVDTAGDQVYKGYNAEYKNVAQAVADTAGVTGFYHGKAAVCYFTASNGGQTALATDIWGGSGDYGYLAITDDPYDLENPRSMVNSCEIARAFDENGSELRKMLNARLPEAMRLAGYVAETQPEIVEITNVQAVQPRFSGTRQFEKLQVTVSVHAQKTIRLPEPMEDQPEWLLELLPGEPLQRYRSWTITTRIDDIPILLDAYDDVKDQLSIGLNGGDYEMMCVEPMEAGWSVQMRRFGHGVGMSQRGAQQMAGQYDMDYLSILQFYYPGLDFETVDWTYAPSSLENETVKLLRSRGIAGAGMALPELKAGEVYARVSLSSAVSTLNMRSKPGIDSDIVTALPNRAKVIVCEKRADGWSRIRTATLQGYVKSEYLESENN